MPVRARPSSLAIVDPRMSKLSVFSVVEGSNFRVNVHLTIGDEKAAQWGHGRLYRKLCATQSLGYHFCANDMMGPVIPRGLQELKFDEQEDYCKCNIDVHRSSAGEHGLKEAQRLVLGRKSILMGLSLVGIRWTLALLARKTYRRD